jgi:hypothetical protein
LLENQMDQPIVIDSVWAPAPKHSAMLGRLSITARSVEMS